MSKTKRLIPEVTGPTLEAEAFCPRSQRLSPEAIPACPQPKFTQDSVQQKLIPFVEFLSKHTATTRWESGDPNSTRPKPPSCITSTEGSLVRDFFSADSICGWQGDEEGLGYRWWKKPKAREVEKQLRLQAAGDHESKEES